MFAVWGLGRAGGSLAASLLPAPAPAPAPAPVPAPAPTQLAWEGFLFPLLPWDHIWAPSKAADIFITIIILQSKPVPPCLQGVHPSGHPTCSSELGPPFRGIGETLCSTHPSDLRDTLVLCQGRLPTSTALTAIA